MSRPLIRSGQWSQTTNGISQPAARLSLENNAAKGQNNFESVVLARHVYGVIRHPWGLVFAEWRGEVSR